MAGLVNRPPFRQQQRGPVQIDRGNALGSKVITYLPLSSEVPYGTQSNAQKVTLGSGGSYFASHRGRSLNGSGSAAVASVPIDLSPFNKITIAAWIYVPSARANADKVGFEYTPTINTLGNKGFFWDPDSSATPATFSIGCSNGAASGVSLARFPSLTIGVWHRVCTTLDIDIAVQCGAAWVDGVAQTLGTDATATLTGATTFSNDTLHLQSRNEASLFGDYLLQDLVFYRGLLTAAEAKADYENPYQILLPTRRPWVVSASQILRPASDISAGLWTPSTGTDLFAMIDETAADDADYDQTAAASSMTVQLGVGSDPASSAGHVVRYRIRSDSGGDITVTLKQGATTIASWTHTPAPSSFTTYAQTLSGGEADSITDYADLRLTIVAI